MSTPIQAQWLFPLESSVNVSITGAWTLSWLALRVWATDRDYWEADDVSHALPTKRRMGYEYDTLTFTFICYNGRFGNGQRQQAVTLPSGGEAYVEWYSLTPGGPPLMPGSQDRVDVAIDDTNTQRWNDGAHPGLVKYIYVVGAYTIRDIDLLGPATSGYGYPPDQAQRADLSVTAMGPQVQQTSAVTEFGSASGAGSTVYIPVPTAQGHRMYSPDPNLPGVTVTANRTQGGEPGGPPGIDIKGARFGLYFHHDWYQFDEVAGGWDNDPNWFQGFQGGVPSNAHWNGYIGANAQGVRYHWNLVDGTAIGLLDIYGELGPAGTCYIGEITQWTDPSKNFHFYQTEQDYSWLGKYDVTDPPDGVGDVDDVIYYQGLDDAGRVVKHELEHKRFWELGDDAEGEGKGNWGGYTADKIGTTTNPWPYNKEAGYDRDEDGVKDAYEKYHAVFDHPDPVTDPPDTWWKFAFSLYVRHNGVSQHPADTKENRSLWADIEFETHWWGERLWMKQEWVQDDWSDHGAQAGRH